MRLFIAAEIPQSMQSALQDTLDELNELHGIKTLPLENLHVTLAFLGEQPDDACERIAAAIDATCAQMSAFDADLDDLGHFGKDERATLWQGFADDTDFAELAETLRHELSCIGIELEDRPFVPHITLARKVDLTCADLDAPFAASGSIEKVTLYKSDLSEEGAHYTALHTAALKARWQHPAGRLIVIDADACPVIKETLSAARSHRLPVLISANTTQNLERSLRPNDPRTPQAGFWVDTMTVAIGADSADFAIVERLQPGDIVVTQDIGLAAMCLGKGAAAIGVRGRIYSPETIDSALYMRHVEKVERRRGGRTGGPAAFTQQDRERFRRNLARLLTQQTDK